MDYSLLALTFLAASGPLNRISMDSFDAAREAVIAAALIIVARHREAGILTWALLHQMEDEVASEVMSTGEYDELHVNMMRSIPDLCYPRDDRKASFEGHGIVPVIFHELERAWLKVH